MHTVRKLWLPVLLGLTVILAALWFGRFKVLTLYYREKFDELPLQNQLLKHKKLIEEDQRVLSKYEVFQPSRGTKDAGPFLNSKVHWEIGDIHHQGSLVLPEFLNREMNKDWAIKKPLFKKLGLNFSWMKELLQYDHWSPDTNSPAFPENKKYLTYSFPVPSYRDLITWAKLRLLYGKETGDTQSAYREVRHLIRLIWTNDYLVSSMVAVNMLKLEHQFHEVLLPEEEGSWELIPEDAIMRGKRYFYSSRAFADIALNAEMLNAIPMTEVNLCSIVVEGLMGFISMRDMMKAELEGRYAAMAELVKRSQDKCRKTIVHQMWEDPTWPSFLASDEQNPFAYIGDHAILGKRLTWKELKENDELKVLLGYILLTSNPTNYLDSYENK